MEGPIHCSPSGQQARQLRWSFLAGTVALGAATLGIAMLAVSASASASNPHRETTIVECTSGIVTDGDVSTSSMVVTRIPTDALANVPGGCVTR